MKSNFGEGTLVNFFAISISPQVFDQSLFLSSFPLQASHGGPFSPVRHVGDLGNIEAHADGVAEVDLLIPWRRDTPSLLPMGEGNRPSVLGRTLVVHELEDDLGEGGTEASRSVGSAGGRVACAAVVASGSGSAEWDLTLVYIIVLVVVIVLLLLLILCLVCYCCCCKKGWVNKLEQRFPTPLGCDPLQIYYNISRAFYDPLLPGSSLLFSPPAIHSGAPPTFGSRPFRLGIPEADEEKPRKSILHVNLLPVPQPDFFCSNSLSPSFARQRRELNPPPPFSPSCTQRLLLFFPLSLKANLRQLRREIYRMRLGEMLEEEEEEVEEEEEEEKEEEKKRP